MKKINFIFIKFIFIFIFVSAPLFLSYSYADFSTTPLPDGVTFSTSYSGSDFTIGTYSSGQIKTIVNNYSFNPNNSDYIETFNVLMDYLVSEGYHCFVFKNQYYSFITLIQSNISVGVYEDSGDRVVFTRVDENLTENNNHYFINSITSKGINFIDKYANGKCQHYDIAISEFVYSNVSIKRCVKSGGWTWDGGSYYYEVLQEPGEDTPILPTNAEIAQAVQNFYNSDYYKNNKDFKEFFVLYNSANGVYSFIGHTCVGEVATHFTYGSTLCQAVYSANYPGNTTGLNYWSFKLETLGSQISNFFNNKYWLYSSSDTGTSFKYDGIGKISDLEQIKFDPRYSTIVYSSTDYLCTFYDYQNDKEIISDGTIPGDQYTDKELLEPTTNEYNPLKNYVSTSPTDTILSGVDGSSILDIINDNIISWTEMNWVFTSVSSMFNTFSSLLLLICVLLLISKIIGG